MIRPLFFAALLSLALPLAAPAAEGPLLASAASPKVSIRPVTSPGGITAWLWQDDTVPVITLRAVNPGGVQLDPKPGVSRVMNALTGVTAGNYDQATFARQFERLSASLSVSRTPTFDQISVRLVRDRREESADLIALALTAPVVIPPVLAHGQAAVKRQLAAEARQPGAKAERLLSALFLGDQAPMVTALLTPAEIDAIRLDDLTRVHRDRVTRTGLQISVAGAISPAELAPLLDRLFARLPDGAPATPTPSITARPTPGVYNLPLAGAPQSSLVTALPGVSRTDPDFWPMVLLNHALGGATFSSRLKQELRETRGMVYSTSSALRTGGLRPLWTTAAAMAPERVVEAIGLTRALWTALHQDGITQAELEAARDYFLGSAMVSLTSTAAMADFVAGLQLDGLPPTYYDDRQAILARLTLEQVNSVARRRIDPDALVVIVAGAPTPDLPPSLPLPPGF